ncbi:glycosyltransferase [Microterricola viridarii]|uniref:glycosyltransferase n=1 Tax=Microterricola viridarii TaxID=412690 RepID=UPI0009EA7B7E|nr:glycosyltransferase [Microterricola viridarii]
MRVAITKSTLRIPPTYFAVSHALRLQGEHEFRFFCYVAQVTDPAVTVPIIEAVPLRSLPFRQRELVMPLFLGRMRGLIQRFRPDVIHQHFATWSLAAVAASKRTGAPLITTLHGIDVFTALGPADTAMKRWHQRNFRAAAAQSTVVLAVSQYLAGQARAAGVPAHKIQVHYQGIDTDYFSPAARGDSRARVPIVLFVGALSARKGLPDLLEASDRLQASHPHELVVVGDGPLRAQLSERVATGRVRVTGSIPRDEIREEMRRAHVLVLPTQETNGWREAAGLVLLEAQACGTPAVAYRSGGAPEMMAEGLSGLLAAEKNVAELTAALGTVLALPAGEYAAMRVAARAFAVNERSLARSAEELSRTYAAAAAGRPETPLS